MLTTCPNDGEAEHETINPREEMVNEQAFIERMKVMLKLHRKSMEEEDDMMEHISQSLTRVKRDFEKWRRANQKQEYKLLARLDREEVDQTTDPPQLGTKTLINGEKMVYCLKDQDAEDEKDTPDSLGEKKEKPSNLMKGAKGLYCLKDGEAEANNDTPDFQQLGEKMEKPPDPMNGEKVESYLRDGESEWNTYNSDSPDSTWMGKKREKPPDLTNAEKVASLLKDGDPVEHNCTLADKALAIGPQARAPCR